MPTWFGGFCVLSLYAAIFCGTLAIMELLYPRLMRWLYRVLSKKGM